MATSDCLLLPRLLALLDYNLDPAIFLPAIGVVTAIREGIGRHGLGRSPPSGCHGARNAMRHQPNFHGIRATFRELLVVVFQALAIRVTLNGTGGIGVGFENRGYFFKLRNG